MMKSLLFIGSLLSTTSYGIKDKNIISINSIGGKSEGSTPTSLDNSCVGKEDGEYWLQLSVDSLSYNPVKLLCQNEYVILDVNRDSELYNFFSSYDKFHYAAIGPKNNDPVNWQEWFLPNTDNSEASFYLSPDCTSCETTHTRQVYDSDTGYYMTGNLYKAVWFVNGVVDCDMDPDTLACYDCTNCMASGTTCETSIYADGTEASSYKTSGACAFAVNKASYGVATTRKYAQMDHLSDDDEEDYNYFNVKPSLGTDGRFCTCYKPSESSLTQYSLSTEQISYIESKENNNEETEETSEDTEEVAYSKVDGHETGTETVDYRETNIVYLTQSDFNEGTYRIKKSGTYILSEDIELDFGSDNDYWPSKEQSDEYPGAGTYRDPFSFGFFAGITVEADYVTIDLNEHELKQSLEFYYQQRWFALIELSNQQFLPGQGPGYFGSDAINVNTVTIKNGILGRTSHFACHGNFASQITFENLHIKDFVTHGIQLNGWSDLTIKDTEFGPSSTLEYLKPEYAHARLISIRMHDIESDMIDEYGSVDGQTISFYGGRYGQEESTITDIADELDLQMEMALDYAMNRAEGGKFSKNDYVNPKYTSDEDGKTRWQAAKKQFIHESGIPSSSSITGIFLNYKGASVLHYAKWTDLRSSNAVLENLYIHDIQHEMSETPRMLSKSSIKQMLVTPWNSDIPIAGAFGYDTNQLQLYTKTVVDADSGNYDPDMSSFKYVGSSMVDAYIAMGTFSDDWDYLGFLELGVSMDDSNLYDWATGAKDLTPDWRWGCNSDIMFHSGKGLLGIRIDGASNLKLKNIEIENLEQKTSLGTMVCGNYDGETLFGANGYIEEGIGHVRQSTPMQVGFSGNNLHGISFCSSDNVVIDGNININNIQSDYGEGSGIAIWTATDITVTEDAFIKVTNLETGKKLESGRLNYQSRPNRSPEACAVRFETDSSDSGYDSTFTFDSGDSKNNIISCAVSGHEKCLGEESYGYTMYGTHLGDDSSLCENVNSKKEFEMMTSTTSLLNNANNNSFLNGLSDSKSLYIGLSSLIIVALYMMIKYFRANNNNNNDKLKGQSVHEYGAVSTSRI